MELHIRQAVAVDVPAVSIILDQAIGSKAFRGDLAWGDKAYDTASLEAAIDRGSLYIASADGDIVATFRLELKDDALWGPQPPDAVYVQRFATASGFRGQKLGSQIFDLIAQLVSASGRDFIRLVCPSKNSKLGAYHELNGFVRVDFKAKPAYAGAPVMYYERLVGSTYQEQRSVTKRSLLHRLQRRKGNSR